MLENSKHAKLSPSSAHRWMECTKAPAMEEQMPESGSSYASEGSLAHLVAQLALENSGDIAELASGYDGVTLDMIEGAEAMRQIAQNIRATGAAFGMAEARLDISDWAPGSFGTADYVAFSDSTAYVVDYKFGRGVKVSAESNRQLRLYGLGALKLAGDMGMQPTELKLTICQPRLDNTQTESLTAKQLLAWAETVLKPKAEAAHTGEGAEFKPSAAVCQFCKAKHACRARAESYKDALALKNIKADTLSTQEIAESLLSAVGARQWLDDLEKELFRRLGSGEEAEGFGLAAGRGSRSLAGSKAELTLAAQSVGIAYADLFYDAKMKSPAELEKELGKTRFSEAFGDLVDNAPGKPKLKYL